MKLKPWMVLLLAPFVGFGATWILNYLIEHLLYTVMFISVFFIGCVILDPFVSTDKEDKS